jgi:hypothetical protein
MEGYWNLKVLIISYDPKLYFSRNHPLNGRNCTR